MPIKTVVREQGFEFKLCDEIRWGFRMDSVEPTWQDFFGDEVNIMTESEITSIELLLLAAGLGPHSPLSAIPAALGLPADTEVRPLLDLVEKIRAYLLPSS
jgi:hypothetical protein